MPFPIHYNLTSFDRANPRRNDRAWLKHARSQAGTRVVPLWRDLNALDESGPVFASHGTLEDCGESVFLGIANETAWFAADFSELERSRAEAVCGARFEELRKIGPTLSHEQAGLLAYARAMLHWHRHHQWCGACGERTVSRRAGHIRTCGNPECGRQHFPRTDPAVIMLVEHPNHDGAGPRCLLGRSTRFSRNMYSTLAGFVEPGESLESAVAREVAEESGVRVGNIRYFASQPWPFPASLMIGFHATAETTEIRLEDDEIEDARWFTPAELALAGEWDSDATLCLPRRDSIARALIEDWRERAGD